MLEPDVEEQQIAEEDDEENDQNDDKIENGKTEMGLDDNNQIDVHWVVW